MATKIQVRRDTPSNWTSANPVLGAGEIGLETGIVNGVRVPTKWKIGDGTRTWQELTYQFPILVGDSGQTPDGTTLVVDQTNDRVGIGTATPAQKLDVVGTAAISGNTTIGGTLSAGATTLSGDLAVNAATNADITTTTSTATVFNTNATTLNIGGAATAVGIGAATGTTTINNAAAIAGNLNIATNKFNVTAASGNTAIAGTLSAGATTLASLGLTTDLAVADGGTGASTASGARTNLGLGSIATQDSSNVSITGGSISGITDLPIADGGTGASTEAGARANLLLSALGATVNITGGGSGNTTHTLTIAGEVPLHQFWGKRFVCYFAQTPYTKSFTLTITAAPGQKFLMLINSESTSGSISNYESGAFSGGSKSWVTNSFSGTGSVTAGDSISFPLSTIGGGASAITQSISVFIYRFA